MPNQTETLDRSAIAAAIRDAIGAHGQWKLKLKVAVRTGSSDISPQVASCDDACRFGKWLYDEVRDPGIRSGMPYQVVRRLHGEFHATAGEVLQLAVSGQAPKAETLLDGEFSQRSDKLRSALMKWLGEVR